MEGSRDGTSNSCPELLHDTSRGVLLGRCVVLVYGAGLLLTAIWPDLKAYGDTMLLVAFGAACFLNFRQNRTLHCSITGPLFLLGALAAALIEAGIWTVDLFVAWGLVLVGVGLAFMIEWRTVGPPRGSASSSAPQR